MRNVSLLIPQWAVSLRVPGSVASVVRSTHAALSPFQSQYFVVIAADCFQGGEPHEHRNLRLLCNPSSSPSPSSSLRLCLPRHFPLFLIPPCGHSSAITCYLCCIFGILSSLHLFCVDPSLLQTSILLLLSLSLQRQAMNI